MNKVAVWAFLATVLLVPAARSLYTCEDCDPLFPSLCELKLGCAACTSKTSSVRGTILGCTNGLCSPYEDCCYGDCCTSTTSSVMGNECRDSLVGGVVVSCIAGYSDIGFRVTKRNCRACQTLFTIDDPSDTTHSCKSSCEEMFGALRIDCCYTDNCNVPKGSNQYVEGLSGGMRTTPAGFPNSRTTVPTIPGNTVSCYDCVGTNAGGMVISDSCFVIGSNSPISKGCRSCEKSEVTIGALKTVTRSCKAESVCENKDDGNFFGVKTGTTCCKGHLCNNSPQSRADIGMVAGVTLLLATFARWHY